MLIADMLMRSDLHSYTCYTCTPTYSVASRPSPIIDDIPLISSADCQILIGITRATE